MLLLLEGKVGRIGQSGKLRTQSCKTSYMVKVNYQWQYNVKYSLVPNRRGVGIVGGLKKSPKPN